MLLSFLKQMQYLQVPHHESQVSLFQKDLLIFKKALYLIQISKTEEGKGLLRKLSNSDSYLKNISDQILED